MIRAGSVRRAFIIVVTTSVLVLFTSMTASARTTVPPGQAGLDTLMKSYGSTYKDLIGGSFWQAAVAQSTLETYDQATGKTSYLGDIANTYRKYVNGPNPAGKLPDFEDNYTDDTAWWGLAWLQAYLITKNVNYLHVAEADANFIHQQWDTDSSSCGGTGGVWWLITSSGGTGRLVIPNGLFLELTAWLHNVISSDTTYLNWAEAEWTWLSSTGLVNKFYLAWDGFTSAPQCSYAAPYWSYNMGSVIAGLAQLYVATKNIGLLTEAQTIAANSITYLAPNGVLTDSCEPAGCRNNEQSFKGIFIRDLRMLATIAGSSAYASFFRAQSRSVQAHDTSTGEKFGLLWTGPIKKSCTTSTTPTSRGAAANVCTSYTQASAEDAIVAALGS